MGVGGSRRALTWRTALMLVPPGLAAVLTSVEPALLIAAAFVTLLSAIDAPAIRAGAGALAIGAVSGPGLELPVAWLALTGAALLTDGHRRIGAVPAIVGLVWSVTWGVDPSHWPIACTLGALSALSVGPDVGLSIPVLLLILGFGGIRTMRASARVAEAETLTEQIELAELYGAAWMAPELEERMVAERWVDPDARTRDRARLLGELGAPRLALRTLGTEPMPTWERAALLNQTGRTLPALFLGLVDGPDSPASAPGVVFERERWVQGERVVLPVRASGRQDELVVRAVGQVMLGFPQLDVQIAGMRLGPLPFAEEGDEVVVPVALGPGVHRMTVEYSNPYTNHAGRHRLLEDVVIELR